MIKPSFKVVTNAVVLLAVLGALTKALGPHIPPKPQNQMAERKEYFLRQAAYQSVKWRNNSSAAYAKAAREGRPILLLVGTPWSSVARAADNLVFGDEAVARYLTHNLVCIRVDASEDRKWLNAFMPYSRMSHGFLSGFQPWVLDSRGYLVDSITRENPDAATSPEAFLRSVKAAVAEMNRDRRSSLRLQQPDRRQQQDLLLLRTNPQEDFPSFDPFGDLLEEGIDPEFGGFPTDGKQPLLPNAFRYLLSTGRYDALKKGLDPILYSTMFDIVDGGFFRLGTIGRERRVGFDKVATLNAEMTLLLSEIEKVLSDPAAAVFARSAFDSVARRLKSGPLIATCMVSNTIQGRRSRHNSFGLTTLRASMSGEDVRWLRDNLALEPTLNPQMVPYFRNEEVLLDHWDRAINLVSKAITRPFDAALVGVDSAEAHCHSTARLLEASRSWPDPDRVFEASQLAAAKDRFFKNGLVNRNSGTGKPSEYLGDWLAYADVSLQEFLVRGHVEALRSGMLALERAIRRFEGPVPGEYVTSSPESEPEPLSAKPGLAPEVADNIQESCTARGIRLMGAYGNLYYHTERGADLRRRARESAFLYAKSLEQAGPATSGYFCATLGLKRDMMFVAVGPNAVAVANKLSGLVMDALVAPAVGPVFPDLQKKRAGVYWIDRGQVFGPMTTDAAAARAWDRASRGVDAP